MIIIEIPTISDLYVTLPNGGNQFIGTLEKHSTGYQVVRGIPGEHPFVEDEFLLPDGTWSVRYHIYANKDEAKEAVERYWNITGQYLFKP